MTGGPTRDAIAALTERESHRVAVVLGSGLSDVARSLTGGNPVPYADIAGMPVSRAAGHEGALYSGEVAGSATLVFAGRVHLYEGHDARVVTSAVRTAATAGCDTVILTNAAGGINKGLQVGDPCLISDHLNLTGHNPLVGAEDARPHFVDLTEVYSRELRTIARSLDPGLKEGVYAGLVGPTYETPAEVRMLRTLGADLVGMSTVLEAITARALSLRTLGISIVTNFAAGITSEPLSHDEVKKAGKKASERLGSLIAGVIERLR